MRAWIAFGGTWIAALVVLALYDRSALTISLAFGAFCFALAGIARATGSCDPPDTLRVIPRDARFAAGVVTTVFIVLWLLFAQGFSAIAYGGAKVRMFEAMIRWSLAVPTGYNLGAMPLLTTLFFAVLPVALLAAFGVRPASLGLRLPTGSSRVVTLALFALPVSIFAIGIGVEHMRPSAVLLVLGMNFLNNGLPEETLFRGALMSFARSLVATPWAISISAIGFALLHLPITMHEEHGRLLIAIANVIGENLMFALAMSLIALRTRSLALPIIIHFSIDALQHMLPG